MGTYQSAVTCPIANLCETKTKKDLSVGGTKTRTALLGILCALQTEIAGMAQISGSGAGKVFIEALKKVRKSRK